MKVYSLEDNFIKQFAEIKSYLEKRASKLEKEASMLRSLLEIVDKVLAEKSFKKVELPKETEEIKENNDSKQIFPVKTEDDILLAEIGLDGNKLKITPDSKINFDVSSPPFKSFLVARILEQMRIKDIELTKKGEMDVDKVFAYNIDQTDNYLKQIAIENYGDERRLFELRNAIKWTFRRMYEKIEGTSN
jgi:hypothetical protein